MRRVLHPITGGDERLDSHFNPKHALTRVRHIVCRDVCCPKCTLESVCLQTGSFRRSKIDELNKRIKQNAIVLYVWVSLGPQEQV